MLTVVLDGFLASLPQPFIFRPMTSPAEALRFEVINMKFLLSRTPYLLLKLYFSAGALPAVLSRRRYLLLHWWNRWWVLKSVHWAAGWYLRGICWWVFVLPGFLRLFSGHGSGLEAICGYFNIFHNKKKLSSSISRWVPLGWHFFRLKSCFILVGSHWIPSKSSSIPDRCSSCFWNSEALRMKWLQWSLDIRRDWKSKCESSGFLSL